MTSSLKEKIRNLPTKSGVYIMKDCFGQVIYIGKAINIKKRVSQYFQNSRRRLHSPKIEFLRDAVDDIDFIETKGEAQALILESKLIKEWKPRYNSDLKDNKAFLLLRIENFRELPVFTFSRSRKEDNSTYFGPYPSSAKIRQVLLFLKREFGVISKDAHPKKNSDGNWILYDDARAQIYKLPVILSTEEYAQRVKKAIDFLNGQSLNLIQDLEEKMLNASQNLEYEKASKFRDMIVSIKDTLKLNKQTKSIASLSRSPKDVAEIALKELSENLASPQEINSMECFDISHISGSFCVASMVRFENGLPVKSKYRHYKIKSFIGNDDFRAMNEVVKRRYNNTAKAPDLLIIDGGRGQLSAVNKVFKDVENIPTQIIGLAKKEETIVLATTYEEIKLSKNNEALKLLQRIRDEAHRFANSFNASLRSKKIKESILDDFNVPENKKIMLLKEFGSIDNLRKASIKDIANLKGISLAYAEKLSAFLKNIS